MLKNHNILFKFLIKITILFLIAIPNDLFSQIKKKKIKIITSEIIEKQPNLLHNDFILTGKIKLQYQNYYIYADKIFFNETKKILRAYSNVKVIIKNKKISFSCKECQYNKNNQKIIALGNVIYQDKDKKIQTEELIYDIHINQGYFNNEGIIKNLLTNNIIKSKSGLILIPRNIYIFYNSKITQNNNQIINNNKIIINNIAKKIFFFGATIINNTNDPNNYIYTEKGYFSYKIKFFFLQKKSKIYYNKNIITGTYMYYNQKKKYGKIFKKCYLTNKNFYLKGKKAVFFTLQNKIIINKTYGINNHKRKKIYFSTDKLIIIQNNKNIKNTKQYIIYGLRNIRFIHSNIQGICNFIKINELKKTIKLYQNPVIWINNNQIKSNKIIAYLNIKNNNLNYIYCINNLLLINQPHLILTQAFNYIKSNNIIMYFKNNQIFQILCIGNSKSIINLYQKNKKIGINQSKANIIFINIQNKNIKNILYKTK